ncbi:MAG: toll/interleukin-1 receptor domain-containing protein [Rhizobiaceae bacterium]
MDGVDGASVTCPADIEDFNGAFVEAEVKWLCPDGEPSRTSEGVPFFDTCRLFDRLPALLTSSATLGFALRYQATFRPGRPDPDLVRSARKAAAGLERHPHVPQRLVNTQAKTIARLQGADYSAEEAVTVSLEGRDWLRHWMDDNLAIERSVTGNGSNQGRVAVVESERGEVLAHHVHPELVMGDAPAAGDLARVARYWSGEEVAALFRCDSLWRRGDRPAGPPPLSPLPMFFRTPGGGPEAPRGAGAGGNGSNEPFYFVSYAHKDTGLIKPILTKVTERGNRIWIDEQIVVGEEWDTRLERMITTSAGLLVFLSPHYVASKHCRRELKFADALDKPIHACALSDFPKTEGFGYIFASKQYAMGTHDYIAEQLIASMGVRH